MDTKFGTKVSNRMLLNVAKFQGYNFYRFRVIKRKPTEGVKLPPLPSFPLPTQIKGNEGFTLNEMPLLMYTETILQKFYFQLRWNCNELK